MSIRNVFASPLMACLATISLGTLAPATHAASAGRLLLKPSEGARINVTSVKRRGQAQRFYLPIGPSYLAYDYPYYYSRGFYPTHIGPGYIYYGVPYLRSGRDRRNGSRCSSGHRGCVATGF